MTVSETVFKYSTDGAAKAAKADEKVRDSVKETGKTAQQQSGSIDRWLTKNKRAIQALGAATAGAVGALLGMSPTLQAEMNGIRTAFP